MFMPIEYYKTIGKQKRRVHFCFPISYTSLLTELKTEVIELTSFSCLNSHQILSEILSVTIAIIHLPWPNSSTLQD